MTIDRKKVNIVMSTAFRKVMLKYMILDCNFNNKQKKTKFMFGLLRVLLKNVCLEQEMLCKLRNLCGILCVKMFGLLITLLNKCFSRARSSLQTEKCLIPQEFFVIYFLSTCIFDKLQLTMYFLDNDID